MNVITYFTPIQIELDKLMLVLTFRMAEKFHCAAFVECSAKTLEGVHDVFNSAIRAVVSPKSLKNNRGGPCQLL